MNENIIRPAESVSSGRWKIPSLMELFPLAAALVIAEEEDNG